MGKAENYYMTTEELHNEMEKCLDEMECVLEIRNDLIES